MTPTSAWQRHWQRRLERTAKRVLRTYAWKSSSADQTEDLVQVGYLTMLTKASDRIGYDLFNAMADYVMLWCTGVTRGQKDRDLKVQVEADLTKLVASTNIERGAMVHQCWWAIAQGLKKHRKKPFSDALQALIEAGAGVVPGDILAKYNVSYWQVSKERQRGRRIMREVMP